MTLSVEATVAALDRAFNAGDLEAVLACYEPDAVLMASPGHAVSGTAALRRAFEAFLATGATARQERVHVTEAGDVALFLSRWTLTVPQVDGEPQVHHLTATSVFRRGPGGAWRLAIDNGFGPLVLGPE